MRFLGATGQIEQLFRAVDAFAMPSFFEPFGNVVMEAMAGGLGVLVSAQSGVAELLPAAMRPFVVKDPSNPAEIAERLTALLETKHQSETVVRAAAEAHPWSGYSAGLLEIVDSLKILAAADRKNEIHWSAIRRASPARPRGAAPHARGARPGARELVRPTPSAPPSRCPRSPQRAMRFVDHPASSTLARDTQEAGAVRARRIHIMIDQRVRRITDPETGAREARRHLGLLFMAGRSGPSRSSKRPTRASAVERNAMFAPSTPRTSITSSPWSTMAGRASGGLRANLGRRIFGRQDAPLHRGELVMLAEKVLDLIEVVRRGDEIIVETYDYVALGLADRVVLDSAFAGTRIVKML